VSNYIKTLSLKSGIWLAPFLVDPASDIAKLHPEWLVKNAEGFKVHPLLDAFWPYRRHIFDIKQPEVQNYLFESIAKLIEQDGFELIKPDFLYAPYFDPSMCAKEAGFRLHEFLKELKRRHSTVHINGCGLPFVAAANVVDSLRIGPDTIAPYLENVPILGRIINNQKVRDVINIVPKRYDMGKYRNIDPDVMVCRKSLGISEKSLTGLAQVIKETNGNILLGDDLAKLSENRLQKYVYPLFLA